MVLFATLMYRQQERCRRMGGNRPHRRDSEQLEPSVAQPVRRRLLFRARAGVQSGHLRRRCGWREGLVCVRDASVAGRCVALTHVLRGTGMIC